MADGVDFTQCVSHGSFSRRWQETLYNMFHFTTLYVVPLLVMSCCYSRILLHIHQQHMRDKGNAPETHYNATTSLMTSLTDSLLSRGIVPASQRH